MMKHKFPFDSWEILYFFYFFLKNNLMEGERENINYMFPIHGYHDAIVLLKGKKTHRWINLQLKYDDGGR